MLIPPHPQQVERVPQGMTELGQQVEVRLVSRPGGGWVLADRDGSQPSLEDARGQ